MSYENADKKYDVQMTAHKDRIWVVQGSKAMIWDTGSCGTIEMISNKEMKIRDEDPSYGLTFSRKYGGDNMADSSRASISGRCGNGICYSNAPPGFREDFPKKKTFNGILSAARPTNMCKKDDVCHFSPDRQYDCVVADLTQASDRRKGTIAYYKSNNKDFEKMCNPPDDGTNDVLSFNLEDHKKMGMSSNCSHPFVCFSDNNCALVDSGHPNSLSNHIEKNSFKGKVVPVSTFMDRKLIMNYKDRKLHMTKGVQFMNKEYPKLYKGEKFPGTS
tara:strand:- start:290 stop:1111 length:822 start_codon:yes stop_codon:yes gene_type:complete